MKRLILAAGLSFLTVAGGGAEAGERLLSNRGLPSLKEIEPLTKPERFQAVDGLFHNFNLSVEGSYGRTWHKPGQPAALRQSRLGTTLGVSFDIGEIGFASVAGNLSADSFTSRVVSFPTLILESDAGNAGLDAVVGVRPLPFLHLGVLGGIGTGSANYVFSGTTSGEDSSSDARRFGGFIGAFYPLGPALFSADLSYLNTRSKQNYGATNSVPVAEFGAEVATLNLGVLYPVMERLALNGGVGFHRVLDQTVAPADTPNDTQWASLKLGAVYALSESLDLKISGLTWVGNDKFDYSRVSLGLNYRF